MNKLLLLLLSMLSLSAMGDTDLGGENETMVVVAGYSNTPELTKTVGDRVAKVLSEHHIESVQAGSAGMSIDVVAARADEARVILAKLIKDEKLPLTLLKANAKGDRYITITADAVLEEARKRDLKGCPGADQR